MTTKNLYILLQDKNLHERLKGELILHEKHIIWSYTVNSCDDIESTEYDEIEPYYNDTEFIYAKLKSDEEILNNIQSDDLEEIENYIIELDINANVQYSEIKSNKNSITFKIFC